jgi:hypothetical protein
MVWDDTHFGEMAIEVSPEAGKKRGAMRIPGTA